MIKITLTLTLIGFSLIIHSQNIDLNNSTDYIRIQKNGETGFSRAFGLNSSNELYIGSVEKTIGNMYFFNKGNDYLMTIKPNGHLGIGTTVPTSHFSAGSLVNLKSAGNSEIVLDHSDGGTSSDIGILSFERNGDHLAHIRATHDGSTSAAFLSFHTQPTGGSFSNLHSNERMRIASNGNVGIGRTNPTAKLDVNGDISLSNKVGFYTYDAFDVSGNSVAHYGMSNISGTGYRYVGLSGYYGLRFYTQGAERLIIGGNGDVGIGTTDTKGFKLGVKGKIAAEEVKVATHANWADFVFDNNYNLPTLKEVEQHIKDKGHLKDIPSAEEVKKNGIFLGDMDSKLLQKIEELTLYTIAQQKQIKAIQTKTLEANILKKELQNQKAINQKLEEKLEKQNARLLKIETLLNSKKQ